MPVLVRVRNASEAIGLETEELSAGANLSMGDMHFSQGDGEVSFCGAIEMSGFLELKCVQLRKQGTAAILVQAQSTCQCEAALVSLLSHARRCDIIRGGMKTYLTPMGTSELHVSRSAPHGHRT